MASPFSFVACATCGCHAKFEESECPICGAPLRDGDGQVKRTSAALLLGLSASLGLAACESTGGNEYGVAGTFDYTTADSSTTSAGGDGGHGGDGEGGAGGVAGGGQGGAGGAGGAGGGDAPAYGVGASGGG